MFITKPVQKSDQFTITIKVPQIKGRQMARSGSGQHHDKRTNRLRTRSNQNRSALKDW